MPESRLRYKGGDAPLISLFKLHIRDARHVFYPTNKGARRAPNYLVRNRGLIADLYALQENLSFVSSQIQKCLVEFSKEYDWWADADEKALWIETMDKRIRKMCKDSREGLQKNPKAPWARSLFQDSKRADDELDKGGKEDGDDESDANGSEDDPAHDPAKDLAEELVQASEQEPRKTDLGDETEEVPSGLAPTIVAKGGLLWPLYIAT